MANNDGHEWLISWVQVMTNHDCASSVETWTSKNACLGDWWNDVVSRLLPLVCLFLSRFPEKNNLTSHDTHVWRMGCGNLSWFRELSLYYFPSAEQSARSRSLRNVYLKKKIFSPEVHDDKATNDGTQCHHYFHHLTCQQ